MPDSTAPEQNASTTGPADPFAVLLAELDWWIAEHHTAHVPQHAVSRQIDGQPYPLGQRLHYRRKAHRAGRLPADQVAALEARPGWKWSNATVRSDAGRERNLTVLREHVATHGSLEGLDAAHPATAVWLRNRHSRGEITGELRRELEAIPGAATPRRDRVGPFTAALADWVAADPERTAAQLRWSTTHAHDGAVVPLGKRAAYVRSRYADGHLSPDQTSALEAIEGWSWDTPRTRRLAERTESADEQA